VSTPASINLHVALVAAVLGFGLLAGPAAVIAQVVTVMFAGRFLLSLRGGAPATVWSENHAWPSQFFCHHPPSPSLSHEKQ
jgi:uncharacterized membrane protein YtjA (UPF0391 family)